MRDRVYGSILAKESAERNLEMFGATCSGKTELQDKTARSATFPIIRFTDVGTRLLAWIRGGNEHDVKRGGLIVSSQTHPSERGCCHHERRMLCPTARQLLGGHKSQRANGSL